MIKRNNKGFTLLELLISIFILTTVIFIGYRVINKSTIDIKNQGNINKGQLTVNDMNEYLTKDLERASSVVLSSNYLDQINTFTADSTQKNKISNENLKDAFINYSRDNPFDYSYNINYKENNLGVIYEVNINKKDENNYSYTIKRTDKKDGFSITFINDEIIKKDEIIDRSSMNIEVQLPFEISLDSPYKVYLGYNSKNNEFVEHQFTVSYRLYDISDDSEGGTTSNGSGSGGSNDSIEKPNEDEESILNKPSNDYLEYCLDKSYDAFELAIKELSNIENENTSISKVFSSLKQKIIEIKNTKEYDSENLKKFIEDLNKILEELQNILRSRINKDKEPGKLDKCNIYLSEVIHYLKLGIETIKNMPDKELGQIDNNKLFEKVHNQLVNIATTIGGSIKPKLGEIRPNGGQPFFNEISSIENKMNQIDNNIQNGIITKLRPALENITDSEIRDTRLKDAIDYTNNIIESIVDVQLQLQIIYEQWTEPRKEKIPDIVELLTEYNAKLIEVKGILEHANYLNKDNLPSSIFTD